MDDLDLFKKEFTLFLIDTKINPDILSQVELAAYEAVVNVIDHTVSKNSDAKIEFNCLISDTDISCQISYSGNKFDISKANLPDVVKHFKEGRNRGLGVYIIRTIMDEVDYSYNNNCNTLSLVKII
jgi:anti-sigma regulatory factor (Ser/Thr protein kinase)